MTLALTLDLDLATAAFDPFGADAVIRALPQDRYEVT
jgi:hypothetical protein